MIRLASCTIMPCRFSINKANATTVYTLTEILLLSRSIEEYCVKNNIKYLAIRGGSLQHSLVFLSALFLSNQSYIVVPATVSNAQIKSTLPDVRYQIIEPSDFEIARLSIHSIPRSLYVSELSNRELLAVPSQSSERHIGYFSSGSTGTPKLIIITSEMALNCFYKVSPLIYTTQNPFSYLLCFHDPSFVISLCYICLGLILDLELISIASPNPLVLTSALSLYGSDSLVISVPSMWEAILPFLQSQSILLHTTISCGEPLKTLTSSLLLGASIQSAFNFYGSTELSTWAFYYLISCDSLQNLRRNNVSYVPIGVPLPGVKFFQGPDSELCISCDHMSRLYLINGQEVSPRYISPGLCDEYIMTGDRFSYYDRSHTVLLCNGRIDTLVKIRGVFVDTYQLQCKLVDLLGSLKFVITTTQRDSMHIYVESASLHDDDMCLLRSQLIEGSYLAVS